MEALNEKKLPGKTLQKGWKEGTRNGGPQTRGQRGRRQAPPQGNEESVGKVPSSEEEIDFWQVRTRARTTDIVACALVADRRRCSAHVEP